MKLGIFVEMDAKHIPHIFMTTTRAHKATAIGGGGRCPVPGKFLAGFATTLSSIEDRGPADRVSN